MVPIGPKREASYLMVLALGLATVVFLRFDPQPNEVRKYLSTTETTIWTEGEEAYSGSRLQLTLRVRGSQTDKFFVDTTINKAELRLSPNMRQARHKEKLQRDLRGAVARSTVAPTCGFYSLNVIKPANAEPGPLTPKSLAMVSGSCMTPFLLPNRAVRLGESWEAEYDIREGLRAAGMDAPDKKAQAKLRLIETREFGGRLHAMIGIRMDVETEVTGQGKTYKVLMEEAGSGWVDAESGVLRRLHLKARIKGTGERSFSAVRTLQVVAR